MSKNLYSLLGDDKKKVGESRSLLTALFRVMLADLNVTSTRWNDLCNKYFRSHLSSVPKNSRDVGNARNNLSRLISNDNISWRNFIQAIKILRPTKIKLTLELTWPGDITTTHVAESGNEVAILAEIEASEEEEQEDV